MRTFGRVMLGLLLGGLLAGGRAAILQDRVYESTATIVFPVSRTASMAGPAAALLAGDQPPASGGSLSIALYRQVMVSQRALARAAAWAGIGQLYPFVDEADKLRFVRKAVDVKDDNVGLLQVKVRLPGTPRVQGLGDLFSGARAAARDRSYREMTAALVNGLIRAMGEVADEIELDRTKSDLQRLRARVAQEEKLWAQLRDQVGAAVAEAPESPENLSSSAAGLALQVRNEIGGLQTQLDALQKRRAGLLANSRERARRIERITTSDPLLGEQAKVYQTAVRELSELQRVWGPESAEVRRAEVTVTAARAALQREADRLASPQAPQIQAVDVQIAEVQAQRAEREKWLARFEGDMANRDRELFEVARLRRRERAQEQAVESLRAALRAAEVNSDQLGIRWNVLDEPEVPDRKVSPRTVFSALLGALLGALLCGWRPALQYVQEALLAVPDEDPPGGTGA